jgi:alpha-ribazole phosphatase
MSALKRPIHDEGGSGMVTTLYLVRHGELEGGGPKRYNGSINIPMSEKGIEQMEAASRFISRHLQSADCSKYLSYLKDIHGSAGARECKSEEAASGLQAVYSSDLARAAKGAEIIAGPYGLRPVIISALRERSFGIWEGMTFEEIKKEYPEKFDSWAQNPLKFSPPGGENTMEVRERAVGALEGILRMHKGDNISIVAHGGINRVLLCHILGIPLENIFRIEQDYASVNIIEFWDRYPVVKLLNGRPQDK